MYRGENMYSYNNLRFFVSMKRNLSMTGIYPQMFDSTFFSKFFSYYFVLFHFAEFLHCCFSRTLSSQF